MKSSLSVLFLAAALSLTATAQQATQASAPLTTTVPSTGYPGLDHYRASRSNVFFNDFGELGRYRAADAALKAMAPGENRVVFFGDSITDIWKLDESFPGKGYINRGIGGQTTSQMLVRFRQDVIDLHPRVLLILAGTNDIAGNTGPTTNKDIEENLMDFADLAKAHNIRLIFSSLTPVSDYVPSKKEFFDSRPMSRILDLNKWLKQYCAAHDIVYLDYFDALVDNKGMLKRDLSDDGLHPNKAGFAVMAPLAEKAIEKELK